MTDYNVRLTKNFWLHEFLRSETASRKGRIIEPTPEIVTQLHRLCELVLQPVRDHLGRPITLLSGYRPEWLNKMVGGSLTSDHMVGRAADFIVVNMRPYEVAKNLEPMLKHLPYKQLIHEFGRWTHLSVAEPGQKARQQILTATKQHGKKTEYLPGLVDVPN